MIDHRVRMQIIPWDDVEFRHAAERALEAIRDEGVGVDSERAATMLQARLRDVGFLAATVEAHRTVDEALAHINHFTVRRD
jgi:hypothetical protein